MLDHGTKAPTGDSVRPVQSVAASSETARSVPHGIRMLVLASSLLVVAVLAIAAAAILQDRRNTLANGASEATSLADAFAAHTDEALDRVDRSLASLASAIDPDALLHAENQADFAVVFPQALLFGLLLLVIALERLHKRGF